MRILTLALLLTLRAVRARLEVRTEDRDSVIGQYPHLAAMLGEGGIGEWDENRHTLLVALLGLSCTAEKHLL